MDQDTAAVELRGGVNRVLRVGGTVVRPTGRHSAAVNQVLRHLEQVGFAGAPYNCVLQDATDGHAAFQQYVRDGHDLLYLRDIEHLEANRSLLDGELEGEHGGITHQ